MSSFFSPFTPNHVNLINACYPSSSALVASGSTCQPNPQELSRLIYYASNKAESSGKLAKIGIELEKRASTEARKAKSGNARARAQLLVTISIFKAVTNECKRDVGLFTKMLLSAVRDALTCLPNDLELQARVASLFTAWATFSDGGVIGPDAKATADYMNVLNTFKDRCTVTGKDTEHVSRMRLVGIAAMTAAVSSDEFYTTPAMFSKQAAITIPALVSSFYEAGTHLLVAESTVVSADPSPNSPYLSEFQPRPVMDRRAASIHAHVDGETGPELSDVVNASLRALRTLLSRCNGSQVAVAFDFMLQSIDKARLWDKPEVGKWYAQHAIEWTQYQYRYAVPTHLVDRLLSMQDSATPIPKLFVTVEMLIYIFNSPTPLINLSTSDIITSLITVLLRRVSIDPNDGLLPSLVECISSLGTHVYYADQIHDLAEEVVGRLVNVQVNGVLGRGRGGNEAARETALRCLLACLSGLTEAADRNAAKYFAKLAEDGDTTTPAETTDGERPPSESTSTTIRAARRNKVSPESWQETLALLCESDYAIRSMYARGLTKFIQKEVKREPFVQNVEASQTSLGRCAKVIVDPDFKASSRPSILASDSVSRFLNALHATIYTLATSSAAGARPKSRVEAEGPSVNIIPPSSSNLPTPNNPPHPAAIDFVVKPPSTGSSVHGNGDHPPPTATSAASTVSSYMPGGEISPMTPGDSHRRHSRQTNSNRKLSIALSLLDGTQAGVNSTLSDFAFLREILMSTHRQVPTRAVLTGVPLLIALDQWTRKASCIDGCHPGYLHAVRELVCNVWIVIGEVWDVPSVAEKASKALEALRPDILPNLDPVPPTQLHPPEVPIHFSSISGAIRIDSGGCIDAEVALPALASSAGLQAITGLDRQGLLRRFMIEWSVEGALKDSVEQTSNQDILRGDAPFLRLSPALMHIENMSLASLARSTGGGVGVNDLREALGRGSVSNPALATASLSSTVDRSSSMMRRLDKGDHPEPLAISRIKSKRGRAPPSEVRDVLNKLGIGKQSGGGTTLRAPFLQSSNEASKMDKEGLKRDTSLAEPPY